MHYLINIGYQGRTPFPNRPICDNIHKLWGNSFFHNQPHRLTRATRQSASSCFHVRDEDLLDRDRCAPWRRIVAFRPCCELFARQVPPTFYPGYDGSALTPVTDLRWIVSALCKEFGT